MSDHIENGHGKRQTGDKKRPGASGDKRDYEVGHGKPPKEHRFKPGQSGNTKGRPKNSKNTRTIVAELLNRDVAITENGRSRKVNFKEAFIHQMAAKALGGTTRDQIAFLKLIHEYMPEQLNEVEVPHKVIVTYVLPDGKTMEDYADIGPDSDAPGGNSKDLPTGQPPDPRSGEDDSYLD